jgi:hypothetical protein
MIARLLNRAGPILAFTGGGLIALAVFMGGLL